jgi:hypothetical protein
VLFLKLPPFILILSQTNPVYKNESVDSINKFVPKRIIPQESFAATAEFQYFHPIPCWFYSIRIALLTNLYSDSSALIHRPCHNNARCSELELVQNNSFPTKQLASELLSNLRNSCACLLPKFSLWA